MQSNTFWGPSSSPYIIRRPITVRRGASLTIAAGVNVVFDGANSGLTVAGMLTSSGLMFMLTAYFRKALYGERRNELRHTV